MRHLILIAILLCSAINYATAQVSLSTGLMAYYPLNGNFNDSSGNGHHGTAMNGVSFGADRSGKPGSAASFDGVDDWISVSASPGMTPGTRFTLAFKFKTSSSALQVLFSKSDFTGMSVPHAYQFQVGFNAGAYLAGNGLFFGTLHKGSCFTNSFFASHYGFGANVFKDYWYCAVLSFDSGVKKLYMNGLLVSRDTMTGLANNTSIDSCSSGTFRIGAWWQNDLKPFKGLIDDVRLYNRALNASEIEAICNETSPVDGLGIVGKGGSEGLHIYPNPASSGIIIDNQSNRPMKSIVIMNSLGASVLVRNNVSPDKETMDVSRLAPGVYMVRVQTDGASFIRRIEIL